MTRQARQLSLSGIYHIFFRGVNHCHLFESPDDYEKIISMLSVIKGELALEVYAYCIMSNHVHFVIKEKLPGDIIVAMRKLLGPYANWFNRKYERCGALISNRYNSKCIENDGYLLSVVRYIHQNPLAAGTVKHIGEYRWSSYRDYINNCSLLTDTDFVLSIFADNVGSGKKECEKFALYHEDIEDFENDDNAYPEKEMTTVGDARKRIINLLNGAEPNSICGLPKDERNSLLLLMRNQGISIRQIERATGVPRGIIARVN